MTLWRMEWLRLVRTHRLWVVVGIYVFFGITGPLSARYLPELVGRFAGEMQITMPDPTPAAGMAQFGANAGQLGLLAVLVVAAGALTFDARPPWSAFLRTRVPRVLDLVLPRVVVSTGLAVVGLAVGTGVATAATAALIGTPDLADVALGVAFGAVYLALAVAVVAAAASVARTAVSTVLASVGVLLALPLLQLVPTVGEWSPSRLLGAGDALLAGASVGDLVPSLLVGLALVPALVFAASSRLATREI